MCAGTHSAAIAYALTLLLLIGLATAASAQDADGDGIANDVDNCVTVANGPDQDAQADADGDGIGNACECGDATGDGLVNSIDARILQRCAVGIFACPALCDVTGEGVCNSIDARLIQRFSVGILAKQDLTCAERAGLPVTASFEVGEQTVDEDSGSVPVAIVFDAPFRGSLSYVVSGSAGPGDFVAPSGTLVVPAPGTRAEIEIEITDDAELAEVQESIELRIVDGPGYSGGVFPTHTLRIDNNDRLWRGALETPSGEIDLNVEILRSAASGVQATLRSERGGIFPAGAYPAAVTFSDTEFSLAVDVALAADVVGTPSRLQIDLAATHGLDGGFVGPDQILGDATLTLSIDAQPHLADTPNPGSFVLLRERSASGFAAEE